MALRALRLFSAQTYPERELIIVADRGEIRPADIDREGRVTLLEVAPDTPLGTRRNLACLHATGNWIVQWDDDDWRGAEALETLLAPLNRGEADIVGFGSTPFYEVEKGCYWKAEGVLKTMFPQGVHPGTLAFRQEVWERTRYPAVAFGEDLRFLRSAMEGGAKLRTVDAAGGEHFVYVRHGQNTWMLDCGITHGEDKWSVIPEPRIPPPAANWLSAWRDRREEARLQMVGVTISSPAVRRMADEAAERFSWATGLRTYIRSEPADRCYRAKFDLARDLEGTVVYFDADLWFLRKFDITRYYDRREFLATLDPGRFEIGHFPLHDSKVMGLDPGRYFNSALMIWNLRHEEAWKEARRISASGKYPNLHDPGNPSEGGTRLRDFGEQSHINAAIQNTGTPFEALPATLNYMPYAAREMDGYKRLNDPIACHAAGYAIEHKQGFLEFCAHHWSNKRP